MIMFLSTSLIMEQLDFLPSLVPQYVRHTLSSGSNVRNTCTFSCLIIQLYATDLNSAISSMATNNQFKQMVFYVESCESGSMFDGLLSSDINGMLWFQQLMWMHLYIILFCMYIM